MAACSLRWKVRETLMARIYSHSLLDAFVCEAKGQDAEKQRYGKSGPARQGQAFHAVQQKYLLHLKRTKQPFDWEAGLKIWDGIKPFITADDVAEADEDIQAAITGSAYEWAQTAEHLETEQVVFCTVPDWRELKPEEV